MEYRQYKEMVLAIKTLIIVTIVANINLVVKYTAELNENKRDTELL